MRSGGGVSSTAIITQYYNIIIVRTYLVASLLVPRTGQTGHFGFSLVAERRRRRPVTHARTHEHKRDDNTRVLCKTESACVCVCVCVVYLYAV